MKQFTLTILDQVNVKFTDLDPACRRDIVETLKFMVPYARHTPQFKLGRWDGKVGFATVGGGTYLNLLDRVVPVLIKHGYSLDNMIIDDRRVNPKFTFEEIDDEFLADTIWPAGHPFEGEPVMLREHQVDAINRYLNNLQSLQEIATGAGKTMICAALSRIVEPYGRSLIIVPGKDLVRQTYKDYINVGLDTGRYYGDFKEPSNQHTIATWQSMTALSKNNPEVLEEILSGCNCVIIDESHTIKGNELQKFLCGAAANVPIRWGLTGTIPKEEFAFLSLLSSVGPVVGSVRADELQEKGILSDCHIHIKQLEDNVSYSTYDAERDFLSTDKRRVEWIAKFCEKIAEKGNTMVLVNSIELGKRVAEYLDAPFIYGQVKSSVRGKEYDSIDDADNKTIVATFAVAGTGISINRLFNLVMVEPGKSFTRTIQSAGRGLRVAEDKNYVDIYDICSNAKFSKRHLTARKGYYKDANYKFTVEKVSY